jgi:hypothetical protein
LQRAFTRISGLYLMKVLFIQLVMNTHLAL